MTTFPKLCLSLRFTPTIYASWSTHIILLYFIARIVFRKKHQLWSIFKQFSSVPCYLLLLRSKCLPQHPVSRSSSACCTWRETVHVTDQASLPYKRRSKVIYLCILSLYLLVVKGKANDSGPDSIRHSLSSVCLQFLYKCSCDLLQFCPNIWTVSHFQRIYYVSICCYIFQHSVHKTWT
jgi:hypothetical protein